MKAQTSTPSLQATLGDEGPQEECAIFGIFGTDEAAALAALGLHALQHRGQEATGLVTYSDGRFHAQRGIGKVGDVLNKADQLAHADTFGGVEEVAKAGVFSASPIPGKSVEIEKP